MISANASKDTANYVINPILPESWSNSVKKELLQLRLNSGDQLSTRHGEDITNQPAFSGTPGTWCGTPVCTEN
jgi:hypothetical protein